MRRTKMPPMENVGASQTWVLPRIPQGPSFMGFLFDFTGSTAMTAALTDAIRVRLGGKTIVDIDGAHLDTINQYLGYEAFDAQGQLLLPFSDLKSRTVKGEMIGAIDTEVPYSDFSIELDCGAATAPAVQVYALTADPQNDELFIENKHTIRALIKATHAPGAAAEFALPVPTGSRTGAAIRGVHYLDTGGLITAIQTKRDNKFLEEGGLIALGDETARHFNRVPQANHTCWDPLLSDNQSDAIPTLRDDNTPAPFEFLVTVSGADVVVSITDVYTTLDRL